jgi:signal transduction histidine kinase
LTPRMEHNGIQLEVSLCPDGPPVKGDPKQLAQVLLNLLLNAIEAMPQGGRLGVQSALWADPETQEEFLQLAIRDTGPGIKEEDRAYLFDPFFTTKEGGTGLGLAIAYSIVQKHNGRIEVRSEAGQGASFVLSFPLSQEASWRKSSSSTMT